MANVDAVEIEKFEALAERWWDTDGEFKPLHEINPLRSHFIDEHSPVAEKKVLDVGCGGGILCESLSALGAQVTGIDMGEKPLSVARLHAEQSNFAIDYQRLTAETLAQQQPQSFDIVTCLEMLEHVPEPARVVRACAKLVKPGGHVYFSTLNRNPKSYLFAIIGAEYVLKLLPKGTHDYAKFIKPSELAAWCRQAKLEWRTITGMVYNPITQRYSLKANDVSVNYLLYLIKPIHD